MDKLEQILTKLNPEERRYILRLTDLDELTCVFNRRYFNRRLKEEFRRVKFSKKGLSLLLLDIDDFKAYQDRHRDGHMAGDRLLKDMARMIAKKLRSYDAICRYGGEELAIICPDSTLQEGITIAERLRETISKRFPTTVSVGVANYPENSDTIEEIISYADRGLYLAKQFGKNKVSIYNSP